ncbi:uncharacterized protein EI97DRAFT_430826 [Westerdykella ornata]|uniref:18S rRNA factor 2 n=1 Tax=Westerdykella ornata TaxID=318751 RepID=A0A6A6JUB4_WESOR|nr:uncharacterized protein EI97DRAFT_430826 [Westerdykella ornata]KAF2279814.1 hypothetical protein EI97DRAFT_430826 [Westerdykella ornata]
MSTRKRNEWLEADESEEEDRDYGSEEEESRAKLLRSSKRQKVAHDSGDEDEAEADYGHDDGDVEENSETHKAKAKDKGELARLEALAASVPSTKLKLEKPLPAPSAPKKDKSGIIYLSRVPPFMKPSVLRSLLTPYGAVGRIFLTPEPSTQRAQRLKSGGTRRKLFLDGWVEFLKKKDAKFVAENLNAQTMGGKKRGRWHDEVWNIKYLSGVKWADLVAQIQEENADRQARMRAEIAQSKRENQQFLADVERGKIAKTKAERKKQRGKDEVEEDTIVQHGDQASSNAPKREFKQKEVKIKALKEHETGEGGERLLHSIF